MSAGLRELITELLRFDDGETPETANYCWWCVANVNGIDGEKEPHAADCLKLRAEAALAGEDSPEQRVTGLLGNEQTALLRLSNALTGGNAATWDEVFHAAETSAPHYYAKALGLVADELIKLEDARAPKLVAIIRNAAAASGKVASQPLRHDRTPADAGLPR